jgi:UDP-N-acetylglucosamine--N-acetylmuramyl-(pentapeptide) pyrophosphoryl-undecaprenol N-acetylglucosamine transferase
VSTSATSQQKPIRILIAGGGTGGHVLPAIAVIEEIRKRSIPHELLWVGGKTGVERQIAANHNVPFVAISTGKLRRYLSFQNFTDALRVPVGILSGGWQVRKFRPDVIFSTGGAVSVPTLVIGHRFAPVLTHEQTAQVGLANRTAARFASTFAVGYEEAAVIARKHSKRVIVTGNPVRSSLNDGNRERGLQRFGFSDDLPVLYVTGGALGATPLNERLEPILPDLLTFTQIFHQAGPKSARNNDVERLEKLRSTWDPDMQARYKVVEFVGPELADIYAIADAVIARAGAGTVSELAFAGLPSILIPLPGTWGDEQTKNAQVLAVAGAAIVIPQPDATPERLLNEMTALLRDEERRRTMGEAAQSIAQPHAAAKIVDELLKLANREG